MTTHPDHQGKRPDQVSASEAIAGVCLAILVIVGVGLLIGWTP